MYISARITDGSYVPPKRCPKCRDHRKHASGGTISRSDSDASAIRSDELRARPRHVHPQEAARASAARKAIKRTKDPPDVAAVTGTEAHVGGTADVLLASTCVEIGKCKRVRRDARRVARAPPVDIKSALPIKRAKEAHLTQITALEALHRSADGETSAAVCGKSDMMCGWSDIDPKVDPNGRLALARVAFVKTGQPLPWLSYDIAEGYFIAIIDGNRTVSLLVLLSCNQK